MVVGLGGNENSKVFIVSNPYAPFKKHLIQRGWIENPDFHSQFFNLKFCVKIKDIDFNYLDSSQIVSHYTGQGSVTNKYELSRSLTNLVSLKGKNIDQFFPRCYDMNCIYDHQNFIIDFKISEAAIYLKNILKNFSDNKNNLELDSDIVIKKILVAITCLIRYCNFLENKQHYNSIISNEEFLIIKSKKLHVFHEEYLSSNLDDYIFEAVHKIALNVKNMKLQNKLEIENVWKPTLIPVYNGMVWKFASSQDLIKENNKIHSELILPFDEYSNNNENNKNHEVDQKKDKNVCLNKERLIDHVIYILQKYKKLNPQYNLFDLNNVWIQKPNGLSRGRGIRVFNTLEEIEGYWGAGDCEMVIMKYIEKPLLIGKRKFDIRVWVTITSVDPLIIWKFEDYYIRLSLNDFDNDDSDNIYAHLTNNSVAKKNKDLYSQIYANSMIRKYKFLEYCKTLSPDFNQEKFDKSMNRIIIDSLDSGKFNFIPRKKTFTTFGFDLMVDDNFNLWLIEINSSPSMETNTNVTEIVVPDFMESLASAICDYNFVGNDKFSMGSKIKGLTLIHRQKKRHLY